MSKKDLSKISYKNSILETIGKTPLVKLNKLSKGLKPTIFAKVEFFNPGGSVKDRIGISIIEDAEKQGTLKPGGTIVESTSGNTGMGLAIAAAVKGYKTVFTMPDKMSNEKISLLRAFGAEVIVTPTAVPHDSPENYTEVAKRIVRETPNSILANQYYNPKNNEAHYLTTGPEIWEQTGGQIDYFIAGMGTGGTISGTGKYLKEKNPNIKVIGIDPKGSILREYFYTKKLPHEGKPYKVEGIGQDFLPGALQFEYIDEVVEVDDKEAFLTSRRLTREEGIFAGGSCGSAVAGALKFAAQLSENDVVVVLLPDSGDKYLSKIYNDVWMREHGFLTPERITMKYVLEQKSKNLSPLISIDRNTLVRKAIDILKQHDVSQLPVIENGKCVGVVTESALLSAVLEKPELFESGISKLMEKSLPEIQLHEEVSSAIKIFAQKNPAILVMDGKNPVGIVTRFDVLEYMAR